ncbi:TolC family protein [Sulfurimonas sp. HSL1-6]|uniref:TolC family protein n=1 Tax=Thiomicrolovo immobilis TaxID=3131935 RepID=UPI0031F74597
MRQIFSLLFAGTALFGFDLPTLITQAQQNEQVQAYAKRAEAAAHEHDAVVASYLPRIDAGASASYLDERGSIDVPETYKAYAEANFVILDGFKRKNLLDEKNMLTEAGRFDLEGFKKAVSLQVIQRYAELQNVASDIDALQKNREQLAEQLERFKLFKSAGIATEEDVERLNAAVADADYQIIARQYESDRLRSQLELLSGAPLEGELTPGAVVLPEETEAKRLDSLEAMAFRVRALGYAAEQADSVYYPTIALNDTYTWYDYKNFNPSFPVNFVDKQNRLTLQLSMNLIDFGAARQQKQVIRLQQEAQALELRYAEKSAEADRALALKAIQRAESLLDAAQKSETASDRTFAVVKKKYEARVVDYIRYLDALSKATESRAQYNRALSGLNSANATYIYNLGMDPKEYVK